ncbi:MAG: sulfatase-like hydrolase/transferase [Solirubrobacterales bacterium]|nr:sulfatase-like hydrolase/transferase [Solirubrobacterales bacterium]
MALPSPRITRRRALQAGGAGALALGLGACNDDLEPRVSHAEDAPNVVLIVTDSTRRDFVSVYDDGDPLADTPNLEALASESLIFDHAVPETMPTGAARRSIITGMRGFPFRNWTVTPHLPAEPGWNDIYPYQPMLTEVLGEAGVETAYVTDNPFLIGPRFEQFRRTLDMARPDYSQASYRDFNRPFKRLAPRSAIERYLFPKLSDSVEVKRLREYVGWNNLYRRRESDYAAARVIRSGMDALDQLKDKRPFFLGVDAFDPHEAFDPPRVYMSKFDAVKGSEKEGLIPIQPFDTPYSRVHHLDIDKDTLERIRELYAAELTFVDRWIGRLLNKMDDLGMMENTAVIYLSDHGLNLGEYGILGKHAAYPNWPIYRVPYLVREPGGRKLAGEHTNYYASTHDVGATVLGFQGIRKPGLMDGEDLSRIFDGKQPFDDRPYFTACYARYLICGNDKWVLVTHSERARVRLFDREADPGEEVNLANQYPEVVDELWSVLEQEAGGTLPQLGDDHVMGG